MKYPRHIHVVGSGLAGLSTALQLSLMGERVTLHEAASWSGGRCRSYYDRELDCVIDNGNHLVLSGNVAVQDYLKLCNAEDTITCPQSAEFHFMDVGTGERWTLNLGSGGISWNLLHEKHRVPGTRFTEYMQAIRPIVAGKNTTVASALPLETTIGKRLWEPLAISALNTECETASAKLLGNIFRQTLFAGGDACRPLIPKVNLFETFVQPCLNVLESNNVDVFYGSRLRALTIEDNTVTSLDFNSVRYDLSPRDWVVLALPSWVVGSLLPSITVPTEYRSIVNIHYRVDTQPDMQPFMGLVSSLAEWIFVKPNIISVTVSAADRYETQTQEAWARRAWYDVAVAYGFNTARVPPWRMVHEKRATIAATPEQEELRPKSWIGLGNLALAGDWTDTGLPSTIEGALRSGMKAAQVVTRWRE